MILGYLIMFEWLKGKKTEKLEGTDIPLPDYRTNNWPLNSAIISRLVKQEKAEKKAARSEITERNKRIKQLVEEGNEAEARKERLAISKLKQQYRL